MSRRTKGAGKKATGPQSAGSIFAGANYSTRAAISTFPPSIPAANRQLLAHRIDPARPAGSSATLATPGVASMAWPTWSAISRRARSPRTRNGISSPRGCSRREPVRGHLRQDGAFQHLRLSAIDHAHPPLGWRHALRAPPRPDNGSAAAMVMTYEAHQIRDGITGADNSQCRREIQTPSDAPSPTACLNDATAGTSVDIAATDCVLSADYDSFGWQRGVTALHHAINQLARFHGDRLRCEARHQGVKPHRLLRIYRPRQDDIRPWSPRQSIAPESFRHVPEGQQV